MLERLPPLNLPAMPEFMREIRPYSPWENVDFARFVKCFVELLNRIHIQVFMPVIHMISNFINRCLVSIQTVFMRLFCKAELNPVLPEFITELDKLENKKMDLQNRLVGMNLNFIHKHLFLKDLIELKELTNEIKTSCDYLKKQKEDAEKQEPFPDNYQQIGQLQDFHENLDRQLEAFYEHHIVAICDQFGNILQELIRSQMDLPKEIKCEINEGFRCFYELMEERLDEASLQCFLEQIQALGHVQLPVLRVHQKHEPLELTNIGNSCYLDSALQALLCVDDVCHRLQKPLNWIENPNKFVERAAIQREMIRLINREERHQERQPLTLLESILLFANPPAPALYNLRDAIFKSGLHDEFQNKRGELTRQHDAAAVMELFMDNLLDYKFKLHEIVNTPELEGLEFRPEPNPVNVLQIPFPVIKKYEKTKKLSNLILLALGNHIEKNDGRKFDPKSENVRIVDKEKAGIALEKDEFEPKEYQQRYRLTELPDVLTLQFKRFGGKYDPKTKKYVASKNSRPVALPVVDIKNGAKDGIVDLSAFCEDGSGAKYQIKSYIVHSGGMGGGHYVAYVEKKGNYYLCDDLMANGYRKITKEAFYKNENAYMVVMERIKED